jgi:hypothetical protein
MKRTVAALMVVWGITASHAQSDPTVTVAGGKIRGALVEGGGAMFKESSAVCVVGCPRIWRLWG